LTELFHSEQSPRLSIPTYKNGIFARTLHILMTPSLERLKLEILAFYRLSLRYKCPVVVVLDYREQDDFLIRKMNYLIS